MRTFEILLLILDLVLVLVLLFPNYRPRHILAIVSLATVLVLVIQLIVEGFRWQMILAYVLTGALLLAAFAQSRSSTHKTRPTWLSALFLLLGLLVILFAAALPVLLPVPHLSEPSGPFAVGTMTYHLVDEGRSEIFGDAPGDDRELMLQVWYPAEIGSGKTPAPYFDQLEVAASVIAERIGLPSFFLGHLNLVDTHTSTDALPPSDNKTFPVLLFSHGLSGLRMQNTAQFVELASHGYIIGSVDHTYDSVITIMPDDRVIMHHSQTVMPEGVSTIQSGSQLVAVRVQDLATALDFLKIKNHDPANVLEGRFDFERVGVMGHSTGGATAIEYCALYDQCQAVLTLDGWVEPVMEATISKSLKQPSMFLNSVEWLGIENKSIGETFSSIQDPESYRVTIEGMGHNNFSDIPLLTPIAAQIGLGGPIDGAYGIQILNDYTLAFFNRYLLDSNAPTIENIAQQYEEVAFESN